MPIPSTVPGTAVDASALSRTIARTIPTIGRLTSAKENRVFQSFDDIVDHCCYAWNTLNDQPWKIMSIARRDWASAGYSNVRIGISG